MTRRGRVVLLLGIFCWIVAIVFGSRAIYPVAAGLVLAVPLAVAWVRVAVRRPELRRRWRHANLVEGQDVTVELVLTRDSTAPLPSAVARERIGRLGEREVELRGRARGVSAGRYRLREVPRGRHRFEPVHLSIADPFGLAEMGLAVEEEQALVVYPRLVDLERPFFDGGAGPNDGRRLLLRRPVGFELHSVREYQQGESLRRVHWPSTARRGQLMVKELEDSPRDEVAVLLDGDAAAVAGSPPDSSFDAAVRAAGSILRAQVRSGRRCVLVLNSSSRETQSVTSEGPEWDRALELVVVTSRIEPGLVNRLLERALSRRPVALVHVEASSFAGRPHRAEPGLLRLQLAGVPIAVVRQGEDLSAALGVAGPVEAAHA